MDIDVDRGGLFEQNSTFDYGTYEYIEDLNMESSSDGTAIVPVLYSVAMFLGLLGHGLVLAVLCQKFRKWSVMDILVLHLTVADVLLMLTLPLWAADAVNQWVFCPKLCKLAGALFKVHFYCEIFLLACISMYLYLSIVHTVKVYPCKKPWLTQLSCIAIWFFSLLLSIPDWHYLGTSINSGPGGKIECFHQYPSDGRRLGFRFLYHVVGFLLPAGILLYCYTFILLRLRRSSQGSMTVTLALVMAFFISWTPYNITLLVDTMQEASSDSTGISRQSRWTAVKITTVFGFLHCCLNPFIYFGLSRKFRCWVLTVLRCGGCALDNGEVLSLWDLEQDHKSNPPQEKCSAHPLSDLEQQVEGQNTGQMLQTQESTDCCHSDM